MSGTDVHYDKRGQELLNSGRNPFQDRHENVFLRNILAITEPELKRAFAPGKSLLDLCCGTGLHALYPAQIGFEVVGVDLSPQSIRAGEWLLAQNGGAGKVRLRAADAIEYLRSEERVFDVIQIYTSLYYFDLPRVLPLIQARLNPGGLFVSVETNGDNILANGLRRLRSWVKGDRDAQTLTKLFRASEIHALRQAFAESEATYVDFLSLAALVFRRWPILFRVVHRLGSRLDHILLNQLGCRFLAFKVVVVCRAGHSAG